MNSGKKGVLKFSLIVFFITGLVVVWLGFGKHGFIHLYRMEKERQAYTERISKLERANQELLEEINRLRADKEYLELMARRELDLIRDNEILYKFINGKRNNGVTDTEEEKTQ